MTLSFVPLIAEKILTHINPVHRHQLAKLEILKCIGSTNQHLLDHAKESPSGWVCLAEQQTQGRGRRGREWLSMPGSSILCSLLWRFSITLTDISSLSVAVGVMLMRALKKYGVSVNVQLKWPNDILYEGRKLAGILIERRGDCVVIGFGLNVSLPSELYVSLKEMVGDVDRNQLTGLIVNELFVGLVNYEKSGLMTFLVEWERYDFLIGKEVIVDMPEGKVIGKAQGISENGELLVLDEQDVVKRFCYGEVSVRLWGGKNISG